MILVLVLLLLLLLLVAVVVAVLVLVLVVVVVVVVVFVVVVVPQGRVGGPWVFQLFCLTSRGRQEYLCASQISYRSQISEYFTNLRVYVTNLVEFGNVRILHKSSCIRHKSRTGHKSLNTQIFVYVTNLVQVTNL